MTDHQKMLIATIIFLGMVGGITWLRYFSPWAWSTWGPSP